MYLDLLSTVGVCCADFKAFLSPITCINISLAMCCVSPGVYMYHDIILAKPETLCALMVTWIFVCDKLFVTILN